MRPFLIPCLIIVATSAYILSSTSQNRFDLLTLITPQSKVKVPVTELVEIGNATAFVDNRDQFNTIVYRPEVWQSAKYPVGYYGEDYTFTTAGQPQTQFVFLPNIQPAGAYDVYMRWTSDKTRSENVPITISHSGGARTVNVNQKLNGGTWNLLETFYLDGGAKTRVVVDASKAAPGTVVADAIIFIPSTKFVFSAEQFFATAIATYESAFNTIQDQTAAAAHFFKIYK